MAKCEYPIKEAPVGRNPQYCSARKKFTIIFRDKKIIVCKRHKQANGQ